VSVNKGQLDACCFEVLFAPYLLDHRLHRAYVRCLFLKLRQYIVRSDWLLQHHFIEEWREGGGNEEEFVRECEAEEFADELEVLQMAWVHMGFLTEEGAVPRW
jgi:hypothetical protein